MKSDPFPEWRRLGDELFKITDCDLKHRARWPARVHRKFVTAPNPGETKVLHVILKRGTYTAYSPGKDENKRTAPVTLSVQ